MLGDRTLNTKAVRNLTKTPHFPPIQSAFRLALAAACFFSAVPSASAAPPGAGATFDESRVNYQPPKAERRDGFAMAVNAGYGLGSYVGYPLEVSALNDPSQQASTGPGFASNLSLWMGGSIRDFLTVGLGVSLMSTRGRQVGVDSAIVLHVETFPLFYKGGYFQDLGLAFDGGLGMGLMAENDDKKFEDPTAQGGAMSTLGVSVFWEPLRFWHFSAGPSIGYQHGFSQTMQVNQGTVGFRMALYGVQPKKKQASTQTAGFSRHEF